jgi:hypothetical protein
LSRDPEAGRIKTPASLHKYLYAGGDPVNRVDPRGRLWSDYAELSSISLESAAQIGSAALLTAKIVCGAELIYAAAAEIAKAGAHYGFSSDKEPLPAPPLWLDAACGLLLLPEALSAEWDKLLDLSGLFN